MHSFRLTLNPLTEQQQRDVALPFHAIHERETGRVERRVGEDPAYGREAPEPRLDRGRTAAEEPERGVLARRIEPVRRAIEGKRDAELGCGSTAETAAVPLVPVGEGSGPVEDGERGRTIEAVHALARGRSRLQPVLEEGT